MLDIHAVRPRRASPATSLAGTIAAFAVAAFRVVTERHRMRRAVADLRRFDDHMLRDIGLTRADLMAAEQVVRSGRRPQDWER